MSLKNDSGTTFLHLAYCGLVLRGYNSAKDIDDPILKEVWRRGRAMAAARGQVPPRKRKAK